MERTDDIDHIVNTLAGRLESSNGAREHALAESRHLVRSAAVTIRALHRGQFREAEENLEAARHALTNLKATLSPYPEVYWTGYVQDAQKEIVEAFIVHAFIADRDIPDPEELGVESAPYLNGLAEAASEMRRYVLDSIRGGDAQQMQGAETILQVMDAVYANLMAIDFPDAVTGGLRRSTDQLRAVLERTRADLTLTVRQKQLEQALEHNREFHL